MIAGVECCQDVRRTVRVPCYRVEVDHAVECATAANPLVDGLALLLLVRVVVPLDRRALEGVLKWGQRGTDDPHPVNMSTCDELLVTVYNIVSRWSGLVWSEDTTRPADSSPGFFAMKITSISYKTAQVDGFKIFYREAGDPQASAVLLLHGFPTSSHMFRNLIPELAGQNHVIAPDLPGFGFSDAPDHKNFAYTFDHLAKVIGKFTEGST